LKAAGRRFGLVEHNFFAGALLDRAGLLRKDDDWLAAQLKHSQARVVPIWRASNLVLSGETPSAMRMPLAPFLDWNGAEMHLLGLIDSVPHFAVDLSSIDEPLAHPLLTGAQAEFMELRDAAHLLERSEAALLAYARALTEWHRRNPFCSACGGKTEAREAGHVRVCTVCKTHHFPRTDPAVIMLVTNGDSCLLAHRAGNKQPIYSTLAGFVEPGESLEEAVAREVMEETGIAVGNVRYHSSQPWPFPTQLMLGFYAEATGGSLNLHPAEIDDAKWFERKEIAQLIGGAKPQLMLPRPVSIARRLITDWINHS
jgi:NAD+ diphosphatase